VHAKVIMIFLALLFVIILCSEVPPIYFPISKRYANNFEKEKEQIKFLEFFGNERKYAQVEDTYFDHRVQPGLLPQHRHKSIQGGISIGTTTKLDNAGGGLIEGTATLVVIQKSTQKPVLLTAGHNVYEPPALQVGDKVVQPASDTFVEKDVIGKVLFAKIDEHVDCSLISLESSRSFVRNRVLSLGKVHSPVKVLNGELVLKLGVNGLTSGRVLTTTHNGYTPTGPFKNHIIVVSLNDKPFSEEGDSGAIVVTQNNEIVGMVRSGSGLSSVVTPWSFLVDHCDIETIDAESQKAEL